MYIEGLKMRVISADPVYLNDDYFGKENLLVSDCVPYLPRPGLANQTVTFDRQSYEPFNFVRIMNSYHKTIYNGEYSFL